MRVSMPLYVCEPSQMKRRLESVKREFYKKMLKTPWLKCVSNEEALRHMKTKTYTWNQRETGDISRTLNKERKH